MFKSKIKTNKNKKNLKKTKKVKKQLEILLFCLNKKIKKLFIILFF